MSSNSGRPRRCRPRRTSPAVDAAARSRRSVWPSRSESDVHHAGGRQREDRADPREGEADARLLRLGLRMLGLIRGRVRHGQREAIDQLRVPPLPQPLRVGRFSTSSAISTLSSCSATSLSLARARQSSRPCPQSGLHHPPPSDARRSAPRPLGTRHLTKKRPDHDRGRVDRPLTKDIVLFGEGPLDALRRQQAQKQQPRLGQKRLGHRPKIAAATRRTFC